jgi:hypothetical protein
VLSLAHSHFTLSLSHERPCSLSQVIPGVRGMTVGGAISGLAGDATSFEKGFFHDTCLNYEVRPNNLRPNNPPPPGTKQRAQRAAAAAAAAPHCPRPRMRRERARADLRTNVFVRCCQVVLGDGAVVMASRDNHMADLYHAIPGTLGSLGPPSPHPHPRTPAPPPCRLRSRRSARA